MRQPKTIVINDHSALADVFILGVHLVDVSEAAAIAGVSFKRIQQMLAANRFTRFVVFGRQKVSFVEVLRWMVDKTDRGWNRVGHPPQSKPVLELRRLYGVRPAVAAARAKGVLNGLQSAGKGLSVAGGQGGAGGGGYAGVTAPPAGSAVRAFVPLRRRNCASPGARLRRCNSGAVTAQGVTGCRVGYAGVTGGQIGEREGVAA